MIADFVADLKTIMCNDAEPAARTLREFGAIQHNFAIVKPKNVDFAYAKPIGDADIEVVRQRHARVFEYA